MKKLISVFLTILTLISVFIPVGYAAETEYEIVTFGQYEQDGDTDNGPEEIEWLVLGGKNGKVLLLSRSALTTRPFNDSGENCTWETSSIRMWLNGEFLKTAIPARYEDAICLTELENERYSKGADCGNPTEDKVFLLSEYEADHYFSTNSQRRAFPTVMCAAEIEEHGCWWMLRTMGNSSKNVMGVHGAGGLNYNGRSIDEPRAIRPAMWVESGEIGDIFHWTEEHYRDAMEWYLKAAEYNDAEAMRQIGYMYEYGEGVPVDYEKAVFWFEKAAELGSAAAMTDLGYMYYEGNGVPMDKENALFWFEKGAEAGNFAAMVETANMYVDGDGVEMNYDKARQWYKRAKEISAGHDDPYHNAFSADIYLGSFRVGLW